MNISLIDRVRQIKEIAESCLQELASMKGGGGGKSELARKAKPGAMEEKRDLDFDKPIRPFIKEYSKGLSGAKKFTLLLAYLSKGELKREVKLVEIEKRWNKMKGLFGVRFNGYYPAEAKDKDWVDSRNKGMYNLRPSWKGIFKS